MPNPLKLGMDNDHENENIASKYEEICALQVAEFCYITDNTYSKEEVLNLFSFSWIVLA